MTPAIILGILFGLFLAYANGANDNFKGVATLFGSQTTNYRRALIWAAVTTLAGSVTAIFVANGLLTAFKGKGLVPVEVATSSRFGLSVALAAASTVMLATRFGFPISTTHSLIGGLIGAGLLASSSGIHGDQLISKLITPLLISPFIQKWDGFPVEELARSRLAREGIAKQKIVEAMVKGDEKIAAWRDLAIRYPDTPAAADAAAQLDDARRTESMKAFQMSDKEAKVERVEELIGIFSGTRHERSMKNFHRSLTEPLKEWRPWVLEREAKRAQKASGTED